MDFDFCIEDHGCPFMNGHFDYEDGCCQGFGYMVDVSFLMRLLSAVGVSSLRELNGEPCWVTSTGNKILKVEPLHKKDGAPFDITKWCKEKAEEKDAKSAYEMRTGRKP